jgi:hypothetical protein
MRHCWVNAAQRCLRNSLNKLTSSSILSYENMPSGSAAYLAPSYWRPRCNQLQQRGWTLLATASRKPVVVRITYDFVLLEGTIEREGFYSPARAIESSCSLGGSAGSCRSQGYFLKHTVPLILKSRALLELRELTARIGHIVSCIPASQVSYRYLRMITPKLLGDSLASPPPIFLALFCFPECVCGYFLR